MIKIIREITNKKVLIESENPIYSMTMEDDTIVFSERPIKKVSISWHDKK